jgi:hypothetical protein
MADDKNRRGPEDGLYVNVHQDHEVRYWCHKWGCSEIALRDAVQRVGPRATRLAIQLGVDVSQPGTLDPPPATGDA